MATFRLPHRRPIGSGDRFCGIFYRPARQVIMFDRSGKSRGQGAIGASYEFDDPALETLIEPDLLEQLREDVELLEVGWCVVAAAA